MYCFWSRTRLLQLGFLTLTMNSRSPDQVRKSLLSSSMGMNWLQPQHSPMSKFDEYYLTTESLGLLLFMSSILYSYLFPLEDAFVISKNTDMWVFLAEPFPLGQIFNLHYIPLWRQGQEQMMPSPRVSQFLRRYLNSLYLGTIQCLQQENSYMVSKVCSVWSESGPLSYTDWMQPISYELFVISSFSVEDYSSRQMFSLKLSRNQISLELESYFYFIFYCFYLNSYYNLSRMATKYYQMKLLRCPIWATNFCISNLIWYPFLRKPSILWSKRASQFRILFLLSWQILFKCVSLCPRC